MAFPHYGVLDSGTRTNEGPPPSSLWKSTPVFSGNAGWKILSNKIAPNGTGAQSAVWGSLFLPAQEVYCNLDTLPETGNSFRLYINLSNDNTASPNGYVLEFWHSAGGGSGVFGIKKLTAGSQSTLVETFPQTLVAGDQIGIWNDSGTIRSYVNGVVKNAINDTTYNQALVGIAIDAGTTTRISNFGGGSFTGSSDRGTFSPYGATSQSGDTAVMPMVQR